MLTTRIGRTWLLVGTLALAVAGAAAPAGAQDEAAMAEDGLVTVPSANSVADTASALEAALTEQGLTVFGIIDHAANAAGADLELLPTTLVLAGNPNLGTPLMQSSRSFAIDLPQKFLVWEDEIGDVFITYNDPQHLAERHGVTDQEEIIGRIANALANFSAAAGGAAPADG